MPSTSYPDSAPTWRVVEVREVRAASAEEAFETAQRDLDGWQNVDTGEAGHTAGGQVVRWAVVVVTYGGHDADADVSLWPTEEEADAEAARAEAEGNPDNAYGPSVQVFVCPV